MGLGWLVWVVLDSSFGLVWFGGHAALEGILRYFAQHRASSPRESSILGTTSVDRCILLGDTGYQGLLHDASAELSCQSRRHEEPPSQEQRRNRNRMDYPVTKRRKDIGEGPLTSRHEPSNANVRARRHEEPPLNTFRWYALAGDYPMSDVGNIVS